MIWEPGQSQSAGESPRFPGSLVPSLNQLLNPNLQLLRSWLASLAQNLETSKRNVETRVPGTSVTQLNERLHLVGEKGSGETHE